MADSDAANLRDRYETALRLLSRGDQCLNCNGLRMKTTLLLFAFTSQV